MAGACQTIVDAGLESPPAGGPKPPQSRTQVHIPSHPRHEATRRADSQQNSPRAPRDESERAAMAIMLAKGAAGLPHWINLPATRRSSPGSPLMVGTESRSPGCRLDGATDPVGFQAGDPDSPAAGPASQPESCDCFVSHSSGVSSEELLAGATAAGSEQPRPRGVRSSVTGPGPLAGATVIHGAENRDTHRGSDSPGPLAGANFRRRPSSQNYRNVRSSLSSENLGSPSAISSVGEAWASYSSMEEKLQKKLMRKRPASLSRHARPSLVDLRLGRGSPMTRGKGAGRPRGVSSTSVVGSPTISKEDLTESSNTKSLEPLEPVASPVDKQKQRRVIFCGLKGCDNLDYTITFFFMFFLALTLIGVMLQPSRRQLSA
mmetsp:Transcript_13002/g.20437  ORF Transcript_13002/g.20437 Transcript_13002/m.20437 type:complete len:376 (-) Transcript_13002:82-1209(-)|eukprot:CAMPEP_0184311044 /NCGR_PEP_ID=MMETSP1049-20130417/38050_1 /TAXON_ID=77928 /ORGANISM="Proteomonas sulcata, Strain CCMP704" /LENGTH=375 /DNA_ID=CAMNT_0026626041 /DNA_START=268 /DNA_END=1395 /DNA_ORIENTATION=+